MIRCCSCSHLFFDEGIPEPFIGICELFSITREVGNDWETILCFDIHNTACQHYEFGFEDDEEDIPF